MSAKRFFCGAIYFKESGPSVNDIFLDQFDLLVILLPSFIPFKVLLNSLLKRFILFVPQFGSFFDFLFLQCLFTLLMLLIIIIAKLLSQIFKSFVFVLS